MTALTWGDDTRYVYGVDRGVLHARGSDAIMPWNGLVDVSVDETDLAEILAVFDGHTYANLLFRGFFKAEITALSFPYEMMSLNGETEALPGFVLTGQEKDLFDLSYRTFENAEDYKIHFVWNAIFQSKPKQRDTLSDRLDVVNLKWSVSAVPEPATYWHRTSYLIVDSATTDPAVLSSVEDILYGTDVTDPSFPTQTELLTEFV